MVPLVLRDPSVDTYRSDKTILREGGYYEQGQFHIRTERAILPQVTGASLRSSRVLQWRPSKNTRRRSQGL